jgi:hypothetical protein
MVRRMQRDALVVAGRTALAVRGLLAAGRGRRPYRELAGAMNGPPWRIIRRSRFAWREDFPSHAKR